MNRDSAAERVAAQLPTRFLRGYARGKLRSDPLYRSVMAALRGRTQPLYDIGCGVGLLEFYLRENEFAQPMTGIDHDARKIATANLIAANYPGIEFRVGDARGSIPSGCNVTALDVLHYFTEGEQEAMVRAIADAVPSGGVAILRDAVRDGSLRYRATAIQERFSRAIRWLKAERLNFPTRELVEAPFLARGFRSEIVPAWGGTPFNNYLFVFSRD